jgi:hypothetical protein
MNNIEQASLVKFINKNVLNVNYNPLITSLLVKKFGYHSNFRFDGVFILNDEDPQYYSNYVNQVLIDEIKNATNHNALVKPMFKLALTDIDNEFSFSAKDLVNATYNQQDHSFKFSTGEYDWQTDKILYDNNLVYSFINKNNQVITLNDMVNSVQV